MSGIQVYLIPNILKGQMILRTIYHKLGNYFLLVKMLFKNIWMELVSLVKTAILGLCVNTTKS